MWAASFCHPEAPAGVVVDETRAERPVFAAAQRQHGVVTTAQLLAAGWDKDVIRELQEEGTFWAGGTVWHGRTAMRFSVSNWSTTEADIDRSADAILNAVARARG